MLILMLAAVMICSLITKAHSSTVIAIIVAFHKAIYKTKTEIIWLFLHFQCLL